MGFGQGGIIVPNIDHEPQVRYTLDRIFADTGDRVSVQRKLKVLRKFGKSTNVDAALTGYTIWATGQDNAHETYVFRNIISSLSSSSTSDVGVVITVEGHTVGNDLSVSSLTQSGGTATCTTSASHNLSTGDWVYIEGANEAEYNGIVQITVTGATTFTYEVDSGATSPATGTITATDQDKTFAVQTKSLNGQNEVTLDTPLARITRMYVGKQNRAVDTVGEVYGYETTGLTTGKPTDTTKIHITMLAEKNQSEKASTSLSGTDYWLVSGFRGSLLEKSAAFADVELQYREVGGVWRPVEDVSTQVAPGIFKFDTLVVIPKNSDVRLVGVADATGNRDVSGSIQGYLAGVIS